MIVELNRRLVQGYTHYKDDPRITNLKQSVTSYNAELWRLGVRDHQVEYAKFSTRTVVFTLIYRFAKLSIMAMGTLPGLVLFTPVFVASKLISIKKSREALAASTVKLQGRDVMATWKLLVALALAPLLYGWYAALLTWWTYRNRVRGYMPNWVPLWMVFVGSFILFPSISFAALRFGETGMDILKSLRALVLCLYPTSANALVKLREQRAQLSAEVTEVINTLGPEMFPDFDSTRIIANPFRDGVFQEPASPTSPRDRHHNRNVSGSFQSATPPQESVSEVSIRQGSSAEGQLPRNESFGNLGNIGLFASRPPSGTHSRSGSSGGILGSGGIKPLTTMDSKGAMNEVSQKIRGAMRERGRERRRKSEERSEGWEFADSATGSPSPAAEEWKKKV